MITNEDLLSRRDEAGFSFVEATVASIMVLMLAWLVSSLALTGMRTQKHNERMARVTEITQDVVDDMRRGLTSSMRLFGNDATGLAYRSMLQRPAGMPVALASARLPTVNANARIEQETIAAPRTGNDLLYARYAWTAEYDGPSGESYRIDVYRIERFFLTTAGPGPRENAPDGLNLARWVSEPLADATQVDGISDPLDFEDVLEKLRVGAADLQGVPHDPCEVVWVLGEPPANVGTLRMIEVGGTLSTTSSAPRASTWEIEAETRLCRPDILDYRHHSVATNFAAPVMGVGRFGLVDLTNGGFPHGFEVQVVGPSSARQAMIHLTLVSTRRSDHRAYYDLQMIVDVRDN